MVRPYGFSIENGYIPDLAGIDMQFVNHSSCQRVGVDREEEGGRPGMRGGGKIQNESCGKQIITRHGFDDDVRKSLLIPTSRAFERGTQTLYQQDAIIAVADFRKMRKSGQLPSDMEADIDQVFRGCCLPMSRGRCFFYQAGRRGW